MSIIQMHAETGCMMRTCIPLNALSANLRMELCEKSSFVIGKFDEANVYVVAEKRGKGEE
jgi:hypothetical protein